MVNNSQLLTDIKTRSMSKLCLLLHILGFCSLFQLGSAQNHRNGTNCFELRYDICPNKNITFWLFNSTYDEPQQLHLSQITRADFYPPRPLKVLIFDHEGHRHNKKHKPHLVIGTVLLETIDPIYVLAVNYTALCAEGCYPEAVRNARVVARCLAQLLGTLLQNRFVRYEDLHVIGAGLGAQVAAMTSVFMPQHRLARITGLDPSKELFLNVHDSARLDPSDADFVDVIHTDSLLNGLLRPTGHVDFYPNMGMDQPACGLRRDSSFNVCNHIRASDYFAESITSKKGFWGYRCDDLYHLLRTGKGRCRPTEDVELMGYHTRKHARGTYFLGTNATFPYALGLNMFKLPRQAQLGMAFAGPELLRHLVHLGPKLRSVQLLN